MAPLALKARLLLSLPGINRALEELVQTIPEPARPACLHTTQAGGKRLRPFLTILSARLFGAGEDDALRRLAATLEMLHAATLMHDDVIDNADTRRGKPAAHILFGNTRTILAGDAMLATANACVGEYADAELCRVFAQATARTTAGEILELHAMRNPDLTGEEYEAIIRGKTACLIRAACEMGALYAGADEAQVRDLGSYGENLGMAFQMVDDALDCAPAEEIGKPSGGDLREGKLTPPLRLYREGLGEAERAAFTRKFSEGGFTDEEISAVCAEIRRLGLDARVREQAEGYLEEAGRALARLPDRPERAVLREMLGYVRDRKK